VSQAVAACCDHVVLRGSYDEAEAHFCQRVDTLLLKGVMPLFVFDGRKQPGKVVAAVARSERKAKAQAEVDAALASRDAALDGTLTIDLDPKVLKAAAAVTDDFVQRIINRLRHYGVPYVVSPYEADAQLGVRGAWVSELCVCVCFFSWLMQNFGKSEAISYVNPSYFGLAASSSSHLIYGSQTPRSRQDLRGAPRGVQYTQYS
jgi:hypothetical protein